MQNKKRKTYWKEESNKDFTYCDNEQCYFSPICKRSVISLNENERESLRWIGYFYPNDDGNCDYFVLSNKNAEE